MSKIKKLNATLEMTKLMMKYYSEGRKAETKAWITGATPVEFLYAMDIYPVYPENHAAIIGAQKVGKKYCQAAENNGYSQDLCSYIRSDLGSTIMKNSPIGGLPKPDFLFCCNNQCNTVVKWFEVLKRNFEVPLFVLDIPFVRQENKKSWIKYVENQMHDLIEFLEKVTGKSFKLSKLKEVTNLSKQAVEGYRQVLLMGKIKPSPLMCFDSFLNMAPIVALRGTKAPIEFYKKMLEELEERVKNGVSAVGEEEIRILWDNIPIWYELRNMSKFFIEQKACPVADTYTNAWTGLDAVLDEEHPFRSLSKAYTQVYLNIGLDKMIKQIKKLINTFDVDGMVIHSNRSCKPYSFGQYEIKEELDIPSVIIESDHVDSRYFTKTQIRTRLEAFLEKLKM